MKLTEKHITILRHTLGMDASQSKRSYRNRYVAGKKHHCRIELMELVMNGFMTKHDGGELFGDSDLFQATYPGALAALRKGETLCPEDFPEHYPASHAVPALTGEINV